jgi:hypothetical protein
MAVLSRPAHHFIIAAYWFTFQTIMRSNSMAPITLLATIFILVPSPAYAYIDPGTGSLIIQGVIGAIAAVGVTLKIYWHKVKVFFSGRSKVTSTVEDPLEKPGE